MGNKLVSKLGFIERERGSCMYDISSTLSALAKARDSR